MISPAFPPPCQRQRTAFTLVELLASMAVLAMLVVFLFGTLNFVNNVSMQSQTRIELNQNGRAILDLIASDLRAAALPADRTNVTSSLQLVLDPATVTTAYCNPQALFWQAPVATDSTAGDLAEVGYFVRWDTTTVPTNPRALLCRYFVNPTAPTAAASTFLIYSQPAAWVTGSLLDQIAPGTAVSNYQGWVADNVIALWIRALDSGGMPITQTARSTPANPNETSDKYAFDSRQGYLDHLNNVCDGQVANPPAQVLDTLPAAMEVALVMIDSTTALRVTSNLTPRSIKSTLGQDPTQFWSDITYYQQHLPTFVQNAAVVYSTRIFLANSK